MKRKLWVKWLTRDPEKIERIRQRFNMPDYITLNGLTPVEVDPEDMELLTETAKRGFIAEINAKWCKNGEVFTFISR